MSLGSESIVEARQMNSYGNQRDTLYTAGDQPFELHEFIIPGSFRLFSGEKVFGADAYQLDSRYGRLWISDQVRDSRDTLTVSYRTLPFNFEHAYYRRQISTEYTPDTSETVEIVENIPTREQAFDMFGDSRLERSGSISRGLIMGSRRDVSLESGLRMQLSGEIVDGLNVRAMLTDENTPIQPEGTTQRLSDFDRVYVELESVQGTARLGDFDLVFEPTEFARFSRKMQGASFQSNLPPTGGGSLSGGTVTVAGATSRGIYRSEQIQPVEGVQGPYRLSGNAGEQFIIIIAGSEQVYLDGTLLTRGESNDYVIDYATGEITFTSRRMITMERRITIDFEYTTNRFTRTLVASQAQSQLWARPGGPARVRIGATFLRESDSRSFNEELGLTAADSALLAQAGDAPAVRSGAQVVPFDAEAPFVQYEKLDTLVNGVPQEIFMPVTAPADSVYRVRFSRTGPGEGDYRRVGRAINGITYEWVGPGLGEYAPIRLLPKPQLQQMFDLNGAFEPIEGLEFFGEWAQSVRDQNRMSPLDATDNFGSAYLAGLRLKPTEIETASRSYGTVSFEMQRRFTDAYFETFDRTRPIEFGRQWNLSREVSPTGSSGGGFGETVDEARIQWDVTEAATIRGETGRLVLGGGFEGTRQALVVQSEEAGLPRMDYRLDNIVSRDSLLSEYGNWLRQIGTLRQPLLSERLTPFVSLEHEHRNQHNLETDSLMAQSVSFLEWRPGISWGREILTATGSLGRRKERLPAEGVFRDGSVAWTGQFGVDYRPSRDFATEAEIGYRVRRYSEYFRVQQQLQDNESVLVRLSSRLTPLRRAIEANWSYEALTERTPLLQETYIRVGPEYGQYVWIDFNEDGIPQVDEFVPEQTPYEGTYARTYVPSDELIPVVNVQARLRLRLEPARFWRTAEGGIRGILTNISTQTALEVQEKSREQNLRHIYFLNLYRFRDEEMTMNGRLRIAQDLFVFRANPRYGITLSFNQMRGMNRMAAGLEERFLNGWRFDGSLRPAGGYAFRLVSAVERNRVSSETFTSRAFDIASHRIEPEITFNLSNALQLTTGYGFTGKKDRLPNRHPVSARLHKIPLQIRLSEAGRMQLTARVEWGYIDLAGEIGGLAAYELTEGRGAGNSYLIHMNGQYTISEYLRASLHYDARLPSDAPHIHTIRMQMSAMF